MYPFVTNGLFNDLHRLGWLSVITQFLLRLFVKWITVAFHNTIYRMLMLLCYYYWPLTYSNIYLCSEKRYLILLLLIDWLISVLYVPKYTNLWLFNCGVLEYPITFLLLYRVYDTIFGRFLLLVIQRETSTRLLPQTANRSRKHAVVKGQCTEIAMVYSHVAQ